MADSFAELWNSSAPTKPTPPAQKLGSVTPQLSTARRPQNDIFSLLSSAGSSAPNSRPITPSMAGLTPQLKSTSKPPVTGSAGGDAFSGLLMGSLGGSSSTGANMTIAERAAKAEKERKENLQKYQQAVQAQTSAWDGLDTLASPLPLAKPTSTIDPLEGDNNWGFTSTATAKSISQISSVKPPSSRPPEDDWDLGDFSSPPAPKAHSPAPAPLPSRSQAIWDLDPFSSPTAESNPNPSPPIPPQRSQTPGDFDFGDREDRLLDDDSQDDDDILGVLSKPVDAIPKRASPSNHSNRATPSPQPPLESHASSNSNSRPVSPPPHILGQIVEMGFSVQQARVALAATDTGLDVQAALETLLSNGAASERPPQRHESPDPRQRRPTRGASNSNTNTIPRERLARDTPSPSGSQQERNIQDQADKLLAQASEIGLSVFNRANAFWNTGKEKVQKAYVERAKAAAAAEDGGDVDGGGRGNGPLRPRWMKESASQEDGGSAFSDEVYPNSTGVVRPKAESEKPRSSQAKSKQADLFSGEPVAYVSPFRRGRPKTQPPTDPNSGPPPPRVPSPVRPVPRQSIVSASQSSIATSAKHKAIGGEKFKLGQYGEAESAYSNAIGVLPDSHLLLVPLYNNRALTRLKTGDHSGAVEDATAVITLVGAGYHPQREARVTREEEGAGVDLGDGLVKAWRRRAEAYEGREKWEEAQSDWEAVAAAEWAGGKLRGEAIRGVGRCRRMVSANMDSGVSLSSAAKPKPKPPTLPSRPTVSMQASQALSNLRKANDAAEAEDQARHDLKDTVDMRLIGWKGGKETNIRALIASLDTVLWPELGWQNVGMADLVSPSQVKVRYTKAIAKLHPDKLNAGNTTLEQRMVANGVFGALNEAWNAFKR